MGKIVERKKKKKKGRPSLLDLQKRSLREQKQLQLQTRNKPNPNSNSAPPPPPNYKSATPLRRSTRRNPSAEGEDDDDDDDEEDEEEGGGGRKKQLNLVLKTPEGEKSDPNSARDASGSNADGDTDSASSRRKRKINAIGDGSAPKGGNSCSVATDVQEPGPATPLPDKKLLLFILDRLQKKDTYGVFSEPVDPEELPDYHEVIEHPMDFGTVKKKVTAGSYTTLEQFESDIYLICSNAMQYNAPDTIYFRQARSIHELAKKDFENLRQDSDDNEPEPKVVRRGRPPTKNLKKALQRLGLDRAGSELSSDATLATGPERTSTPGSEPKKVPLPSDRPALADSSGRFNGSRNDSYWLTDGKFERNEEAAVSVTKGMKHGKKPSVLDENRRNTYKQFHASAVAREPSVLTTFDAERKQLMAVGLMSEHGYARSLARFAANVGSVAWKIASKKIEESLPPGVEFGPGWVGENDIPPPRPLFPSSPSSTQVSLLWPFSVPANQWVALPLGEQSGEENVQQNNLEGDDLREKPVSPIFSDLDGIQNSPLSSFASASLGSAVKSENEVERSEAVEGSISPAGFTILNSSVGFIRPRPSLQSHQSPMIHPGMNGFNGAHGFSFPTNMGKSGGSRPSGFSFHSPQMVDAVSRANANVFRPVATSSFSSGNPLTAESASAASLDGARPNSGSEMKEASRAGLQPHPSWQSYPPQSPLDQGGLSPRRTPVSVPPDLNVRFQGPMSPSSSRPDAAQPDLALQL